MFLNHQNTVLYILIPTGIITEGKNLLVHELTEYSITKNYFTDTFSVHNSYSYQQGGLVISNKNNY